MVNILYNIIILEFSMFFYVTYDCVTVTANMWQICNRFVTNTCDVMLTSNLKSKIKKLNRR